MADTSHNPVPGDLSAARQIRVFLSSTFRDFMEERDLLVKKVFPELRRKARERGVEVVDVDLRWGITEEESRQGKVIPICLVEIDRCRPYFVGMLGERYGWIPPANQYSPQVIERQPWLTQHLGGVSVTELEILHGVLNDPAMAGRAFFYFRDPRWSRCPDAPGYVCETAEEEEKLSDLKQRIHTSGFPVTENIPNPKALADQIGHDLWDLIKQQYPDLDEADDLEREERQHASYRRSRLGVYLGGKRSINQLERLIDAGQQKILITGESGAGKSALIANWIEVHRQNHPEDVVFAHHLGCSNDASAIRPLLARLIDTAKQQLPEVYGYSLSVPQDWWELVAKAVEALQSLGRWAQQNNHSWIWVLDGLDRLDQDDQNALPWLPITIPMGVVIVASALECPAREILLERKFKTRTIAPLKAKEQDALIKQYLGRYTKQLIAELRNAILSHPLAGSPLFLRVLLEELRQCGRYETLADQLAGYLSAETIDDLYERVLERLEADGNGENVRKVMTALWASRAGLSEEELLAITGLRPLQWAPIDLALEEALGRDGNRLVFDHDYLRKAVEDRYLPTEEERRQAHSELADWFGVQNEWDARKAEEWPWQLLQAGRKAALRALLLNVSQLFELSKERDDRETINYWLAVEGLGDGKLDELIGNNLQEEIEKRRKNSEGLIYFVDRIAELFDEAGLYREPLLKLRVLSLELEEASNERSEEAVLCSLAALAGAHHDLGEYDAGLRLYQRCLEAREKLLGAEHPDTLATVANLGMLHRRKGHLEQAEAFLSRCLEARQRKLGPQHPATLTTLNNLALVYDDKGDSERARDCYTRCLTSKEDVLGPLHESTLSTVNNLGLLSIHIGEYEQAENLLRRCLEARLDRLGKQHPKSLITLNNLGLLYDKMGEHEKSKESLIRSLQGREQLLGTEHPDTLTAVDNLARHFKDRGNCEQALLLLKRALESSERLLGSVHPDTTERRDRLISLLSKCKRHQDAVTISQNAYRVIVAEHGESHPEAMAQLGNQAALHEELGELEQAKRLYKFCLDGYEKFLGNNHTETLNIAYLLADVLSQLERHAEAIPLRRRELAWCREQKGDIDPDTLASINGLAIDLREIGELQEAEALFRELVAARQQVLEPEDFQIGRALGGLAKTLEAAGKLEEALDYSRQALAHRKTHEGPDAWWTNRERLDLARVLQKLGRSAKALSLLDQLLMSMKDIIEPDDSDTRLMEEAEALRKDLGSSMG